MFYHPEFKDERYISYFTFSKKPEIDFSGFNSLENSIIYSKEIEDTDDIKYLTIGYCSVGGIMMDLNDETQGQIYYYEPDAQNNAYQKIADNIFDFVRNLKEVFESEEHLEGIKYSQLYKKMG
ncbi:hypothetical protein [Aquimarina agarivorans]|uniref:hypothetical protein n=1 Tax=Aquimarina agarivorans TaxID=980584 RepID=UPI000248ED01|nr:hypothetical protein [Aquimarina agarivorans]